VKNEEVKENKKDEKFLQAHGRWKKFPLPFSRWCFAVNLWRNLNWNFEHL